MLAPVLAEAITREFSLFSLDDFSHLRKSICDCADITIIPLREAEGSQLHEIEGRSSGIGCMMAPFWGQTEPRWFPAHPVWVLTVSSYLK